MGSTLKKAENLHIHAQKKGFDWPNARGVIDKVREELDEVIEAVTLNESQARIAEELGDLLFSVVSLARHLNADPEIALEMAIDKFSKRFKIVERSLKENKNYSLEELETLWNNAKQELS